MNLISMKNDEQAESLHLRSNRKNFCALILSALIISPSIVFAESSPMIMPEQTQSAFNKPKSATAKKATAKTAKATPKQDNYVSPKKKVILPAPAAAKAADLKKYDKLDPKDVVPDRPFRQALTYYEKYKNYFPNKNYMVIIDYTQRSDNKRMYVINLKTGQVQRHVVAHGQGSDPKKTGYAQSFSNVESSHKSSLGFFRTANTYYGKHQLSLRLDGLSKTNINADNRNIVIHGARYVQENSNQIAGRSYGCPAVDNRVIKPLIGKIKHGALVYAWGGQ